MTGSQGEQTLINDTAINAQLSLITSLLGHSECTFEMELALINENENDNSIDKSDTELNITCKNVHGTTIGRTVDELRKVNISQILSKYSFFISFVIPIILGEFI